MRIQDVARIRNRADIEVFGNLELKGLGGTIFAVFSYVDELVESGEPPIEGAAVFYRRPRGLSAHQAEIRRRLRVDGWAYVQEPDAPGDARQLIRGVSQCIG
ncbi:MAG: hypothetical protein ACLTQI_05780 [Slackia sp.]